MARETTNSKAPAKLSGRIPYHPPRLVLHGRVRDLTASGSGTKKEDHPIAAQRIRS